MTANSSKYTLLNRTEGLINSDKLSDVCFLVGKENEAKKIKGHKQILSIGSPVFEQMFFGDLVDERDLIPIPDQTPAAFLNMITYIYSTKMDFPIQELYDTYMAGKIFKIHNWFEATRDYLKNVINKDNNIFVYDQIIRLKENFMNEKLLNKLRNSIDESSFTNENFKEISEDTLIDILRMNFLQVNEFTVLTSCLDWIKSNSKTISDMKAKFKLIRRFIKFSEISLKDLQEIKKLDWYLEDDEIGRLYLFLIDRQNRLSPFRCITSRKIMYSSQFSGTCFSSLHYGEYVTSFTVPLFADKNIFIKSIATILPKSLKNLRFELSLEGKLLDCNVTKIFKGDGTVLVFKNDLPIRSGFKYNLKFHFEPIYITNIRMSRQKTSKLNTELAKIKFKIHSLHCIKKIDFCFDR